MTNELVFSSLVIRTPESNAATAELDSPSPELPNGLLLLLELLPEESALLLLFDERRRAALARLELDLELEELDSDRFEST